MNPSSSSTCSKRKRDQSSLDDEPESSSKRPKNDVFINYSFQDIGKTFISHLRSALDRNSFAMSDHTMLPVGQDMCLELLKAIQESEMYVVVFSPDYASSVRSLDELVDIMDSFNKFDERKVLPVFYKVEPSDVRSQQGPFIEAFQAHHINTNLDPQRVQKWRHALKDAGNLSGLPLQNGDEAEFVLKVVEELGKMQRPQELHVTDHPVGIGSRAEELISTLRLDQTHRVLVVAVFGFSGIGKTTIVKEVFNRIAPSFDLSCFLADVHSFCQVLNWKVELPKALISCLTRENKFSIMSNHNEGVTKIRRLVSRQKVLLVLDDVDHFQRLESLGISPNWFHEGSRIIVTTRDKRSLGNIPYALYEIRLLNRRESLNLFTRLMFARDDPINTKFIEEVAGRAGGIPLVLKVWSSHFKQYEREQWPSILETLKRIPHGDVQKQLQLSYDSLPNRSKKLFLDIACFFDSAWEDKDLVVKVSQDEDLGFFPNIEIKYLVDKSLVEITSDNELWMHQAIREMGLEIVRQENEDDPMPYSFKEGHVTTLDLYDCNLSEISSGGVVTLASLKHLNLTHVNSSSHCDILLQLHQLNTIEFYECNLIQSIPNLPANITSIVAWYCSSLVNLPCNISELKSLTVLNFNDCKKLGSEDPHSLMKVTGLTNLAHLTIRYCSVSQVPSEIGNLVSLKELNLSANPFCSLPDTLSNLSQLHYLNIEECHQLRLLPLLPPNLKYITADRCHLLDVTPSVFQCLKVCYKESPFSNGFMIRLSRQEEVPDWCSYRNRGDVLSFVVPLNLEDNICGFILCANTPTYYYRGININPEVHNKTKNTSHSFKDYTSYPLTIVRDCMWVMWYPLDDTTLLVEPGDSVAVVLQVPQGSVSSCGLRLIYESDVVDSNLVTQTATEPTPHIPSETGVTQLHAISIRSQCDDYLFFIDNFSSQDEDEPTSHISLEMPTVPEPYPLSSPLELRLFR